MKIALLSGSIDNDFAVTIILKLKQQGHRVSSIVVRDYHVFRAARISAGKHGIDKIVSKVINKLTGKNCNCGSSVNDPYTREYINSLNDDSDVTLRKVIADNKITSLLVNNINKEKSLMHLRSLNPDMIISLGAGIVRRKLIDIPKLGILNSHMGLLPEYKGMNVLEWSLLNGDPIGITIHYIDKGIDTGDILLKKNIPVGQGDTIRSLRDKSRTICTDAIATVVNGLMDGSLKPQKQPLNVGKQYFVMHKRLKDLIDKKLSRVS